jgi:hypothetical protein
MSGTELMSAAMEGCAARIVVAANARLKKLRISTPLGTSVLGAHNSNNQQWRIKRKGGARCVPPRSSYRNVAVLS